MDRSQARLRDISVSSVDTLELDDISNYRSRTSSTSSRVSLSLITPRFNLKRKIIFFLDEVELGFNYAMLYHTLVTLLLGAAVVLDVMSTVEKYADLRAQGFILMSIMVIIVIVEYILRLITCSKLSVSYRGWRGRLRYLSLWANVVETVALAIALLVSIMVLVDDSSDITMVPDPAVRLLGPVLLMRIERYVQVGPLLWRAFVKTRKELLAAMFMIGILIVFLAFLGYLLEHPADVNGFDNISQTLYWATITITTVGYGDVTPQTFWGRTVMCLMLLFSSVFFSIPAGIVATSYALNVELQKKQTIDDARRQNLAALLIQRAWQHYVVKKTYERHHNRFYGTWKRLMQASEVLDKSRTAKALLGTAKISGKNVRLFFRKLYDLEDKTDPQDLVPRPISLVLIAFTNTRVLRCKEDHFRNRDFVVHDTQDVYHKLTQMQEEMEARIGRVQTVVNRMSVAKQTRAPLLVDSAQQQAPAAAPTPAPLPMLTATSVAQTTDATSMHGVEFSAEPGQEDEMLKLVEKLQQQLKQSLENQAHMQHQLELLLQINGVSPVVQDARAQPPPFSEALIPPDLDSKLPERDEHGNLIESVKPNESDI